MNGSARAHGLIAANRETALVSYRPGMESIARSRGSTAFRRLSTKPAESDRHIFSDYCA
jgi:hypothetical protein